MATEVPVRLKLKAVDKLSGVLKKAGKGFDRLKKATQRASNQFERFKEKTKGIRDRFSQIGKGVGDAGKNLSQKVTLPIVGLGAGILTTAANFEKAMNNVKAKSNATGKDFKNLRDLAMQLGSSTKFSASEAAEGMAFLAQAGFDVNEIIAGTPALLDLAASSSTDLGTAADIASNIMGAFKIPKTLEGTTRAADVLARTTAASNVDMIMLSETMKQAGPLAENFGASIEETAAAAGLLGNIGIQGSNAGTALKNAFLNLSAPTGKAKKILEGLGISVTDSQGNMLKFGDIMQNLGSRLSKLPQSARLQALNAIFGKIGIAAATNLAEVAKTGELDKMTKKLFAAEGTAASMAKTMNEGLAGATVEMRSAMEGLALAIAGEGKDSPLGAFTAIIKTITKFVQEISGTRPEIFKMGVVAAMVAAAFGPLVFVLGGFLKLVPMIILGTKGVVIAFGFLKGAFLGALAAAKLLAGGLAFLASPFIAIPLLIAGVVAAGIYLYKNWDTVKIKLAEAWEKIKSMFQVGLIWINDKFKSIFGVGLIEIVGRAMEAIATKIMQAFKWISEKAKGLLDMLPDFVKTKIGLSAETDKSLGTDFKFPKVSAAPTDIEKFSAAIGAIGPEAGMPKNVVQLGAEKKIRRAETPATKNESKVMVKFDNLPQGATIQTESTDDTLFNVDTGLQAGSL